MLRMRGVKEVRANPSTRNVLIHFDPGTTCPPVLAEALCAVSRDVALGHFDAGGGGHVLRGAEPARNRRVPRPLRRTARKVGPTLRRVHRIRKTATSVQTAFDIGRLCRTYLAGGKKLALSAEILLSPGSLMLIASCIPWVWFRLDRLIGRELLEFLLQAADVLIKLFCGGFPSILIGCLEGLLLLADVLS
jgi:hypothetical protein